MKDDLKQPTLNINITSPLSDTGVAQLGQSINCELETANISQTIAYVRVLLKTMREVGASAIKYKETFTVNLEDNYPIRLRIPSPKEALSNVIIIVELLNENKEKIQGAIGSTIDFDIK